MSSPRNFFSHTPTDSEVWRAIVAFGRNSATYKFAFGRAILNLAGEGITSATTEDLALPFASAICEHLKHSNKQTTREPGPGSFLATCRAFNEGAVDESQLLRITAEKGFVNVIEAFQNLDGLDETRFYSGSVRNGISFHDPLLELASSLESTNLKGEIEARWRMVESAWSLKLSSALIHVEVDSDSESLFLRDQLAQRANLTSARPALNAYQKGSCFYCKGYISIEAGASDGSHIDHFLPFLLRNRGLDNVNGIWNLVLACSSCNLSKGAQLPHENLPERLVQRNNWYCESKHPLSETIRAQTGKSPAKRLQFLQTRYKNASAVLGAETDHGWLPADVR